MATNGPGFYVEWLEDPPAGVPSQSVAMTAAAAADGTIPVIPAGCPAATPAASVFASQPTEVTVTSGITRLPGTLYADDFAATGLTGATAASRYVGATVSGAPATGSFTVGDWVIDQTGKMWICTTAGAPGTWTAVSGGSPGVVINPSFSPAAVQAALTAGGLIFARAGTYTTGPLYVYSNTTVICDPGAVFLLAAGTNAYILNAPSSAYDLANFRWYGGVLDGNTSNQAGASGAVSVIANSLTNFTLEEVVAQNCYEHGIHWAETIRSAGAKRVVRCTVNGHGQGKVGYGIYPNFSPYSVIEDCAVFNGGNSSDAIEAGNATGYRIVHNYLDATAHQLQWPHSDDCLIEGNTVLGSTIQNDTNTGNRTKIVNNTVGSASAPVTPAAGYAGIRAYGDDQLIEGNTVYVTTRSGIHAFGNRGKIIANYISSADPSGVGSGAQVGNAGTIGGANGIIRDNYITGGFAFGVQLQDTGQAVEGNHIVLTGSAVTLQPIEAFSTAATFAKVRGNRCLAVAPGAGNAGIEVAADDAIIEGNEVTVTTGDGIHGWGNRAIVKGNRVVSTASSVIGAGIALGNQAVTNPVPGAGARAEGNIITGGFASGISHRDDDQASIGNYISLAGTGTKTGIQAPSQATLNKAIVHLLSRHNTIAAADVYQNFHDQLPASALVSAADYGAVGDGTTDNATALTNWVNAINAAPTGSVGFLPGGNYGTTAPPPAITKAGVTLMGTGWAQSTSGGTAGSTITALSGYTGGPLLTLSGEGGQIAAMTVNGANLATTVVAVTAINCQLHYAQVRGASNSTSGVTAPAVPASGTAVTNTTGQAVTVTIPDGTITAVTVTQPGDSAQAFSQPAPTTALVAAGGQIAITYSVAPSSWTWTGIGVALDIRTGATSAWVHGCRINGINYPNIGIMVNDTDAIISNSKPCNDTYSIVLLAGANGTQILGNHMTPGATNGYTCVWAYGASSHILIAGNRFDNYTRNAVQLTPPASTPDDITITGNDFYSNVVSPDNTYALVAVDTTSTGVRSLQVRGNNGWAGSTSRPAYGVAALAIDGTTPASSSRLGGASFGTSVTGNTFYVGTSFFPSGQTPTTALNNQITTDGTTFSQASDVYSFPGGGSAVLDWMVIPAPNGTDDTSNIESTVSAAAAAGVPVFFRGGLGPYKTSSTLNWKIPGLQVYSDGSANVKIIQKTANTPILQVAGEGQMISGLTLAYTTQQTAAQTSAIAIEFGDDSIGSCFESTFSDLYCQLVNTGLAINPAITSVAGLFSCNFQNIHVNGYSYSAIRLVGGNGGGANCTGCEFTNTYVHNNFLGSDNNSTWWPVFISDWDEVVFNQLNVEHAQVFDSDPVAFVSVGNAVVNGLHLEHLELSGSPGFGFVYVSHASTAIINGLSIRYPTMTGTSYNSVIRMFGTGPKCLLRGLNEPNDGNVATVHPLVDFGSATGATMALEGAAADQTTEDSINAGTGCSVQRGPWADLTSAQTLSNKTLKDTAETLASNSAATGSVTVDLSQGNVQALTLTGNVTSLAFSNVPSAGAVSLTLYLTQDSTGGRTVTWPGSISWLGGVAASVAVAPSAVTVVILTTLNGGTGWYGSAVAGAPSLPLSIGNGGTGSSVRNFAGLLTPTAIKTGAYTAQPGDFVPVDTTGGAVTISLIAAPADLTVIRVQLVKGSNAVTVQRSGSDTFNDDASTSLTLSALNQSVSVQYSASAGVWYYSAISAGGSSVVIDTTTGDIAASPGTAAAGSVGKAADSGHVHPQPSMFAPTGLTGAVTASRYVGGTSSAAPTSGTFAVGDFVVTSGGQVYVCTAAGSPGEWSLLGAGTGYGLSPQSLGLAIATCPPGQPLSGVALTSQKVYWFQCTATKTTTITTLGIYQTAAGVTAVGGSTNGLAIYAASGGSPLTTTGDMTSAFAGTISGYQATEGTLSPSQRVIAGTNYWLAVLTAFSGTTPSVASATASGNRGAVNGVYVAQTMTGQTSFPSLTPGSSQNQAQLFFIYGR